MNWRTKPTDRFILRFIKMRLAAPLSRLLVRLWPGLPPNLVTVTTAAVGVTAGVSIGLGQPLWGAALAALGQVLDGVDGQVARLTGRVTRRGAFLDSVLDRYVDFSLLFGLLVLQLRTLPGLGTPAWVVPALLVTAALACAGASQVSYSTARARELALGFRRPELLGKGTRTTVAVAAAALQPLWPWAPAAGLAFLALAVNTAVLVALWRSKEGDHD